MNISYKQRMGIILIIAFAFIALGAVQEFTDIKLSETVNRELSFALMVFALMAYFAGRKKSNAKSEKDDSTKSDDVK